MKISMFILAGLFAAMAASANEKGNGGDPYAAAWVSTGNQIASYLDTKASSELKALVSGDSLRKIISKTIVQSTTEDINCKGIVRPACNYPSEHRIIYNREGLTLFSSEVLNRLIFHEYLEVSGLEDESYRISNLLKIYEPRDYCFNSPCPDTPLESMRALFAKAQPLDLNSLPHNKMLFVNLSQQTVEALDSLGNESDPYGNAVPILLIDNSKLVPQIGVSAEWTSDYWAQNRSLEDQALRILAMTMKPVTNEDGDSYILPADNRRVTFRVKDGSLIFRQEAFVAGQWRDFVYGYFNFSSDKNDAFLERYNEIIGGNR